MGYNFVTHRKISQKLITCNFERDVKKGQINKDDAGPNTNKKN